MAYTTMNFFALIGWVMLVAFPKKKITQKLILSGLWSVLLGVAYIYFISKALSSGAPGDFSSAEGVSLLFQNKTAVLAGWLHYLAFDLFIGSWIVKDSTEKKINHLAVLPSLLLTVVFGPIGLITYLAIRKLTYKDN